MTYEEKLAAAGFTRVPGTPEGVEVWTAPVTYASAKLNPSPPPSSSPSK